MRQLCRNTVGGGCLSERVYKLVLQESIPAHIRRHIGNNDKKNVDGFVRGWGLTFAKRLYQHFLKNQVGTIPFIGIGGRSL